MRTLFRGMRAAFTTAVLLGALTAGQAHAQAQTISFEDVATNSSGLNNNFNSLLGFTFVNWNVATTTSLGLGTNANSGSKFAMGQDNFSSIFRAGNERFSVFTAWLSFRQFDVTLPDNSPVGITVNGYRAGDVEPTFVRMIMLTNTTQQFTFDWTDIEELSFETGNLVGPNRTVALALDDMSVVVPEPATVLLMATGLLMLLVIVRNKRRA